MAGQQQVIYSCPKCGSTNLTYQIIDTGTVGVSTNRVVIQQAKEKKGCLYWAIIGWWWRPIRWIFYDFWVNLFGRKHRGGLNVHANKIRHKKVAICQNCGHSWNVK